MFNPRLGRFYRRWHKRAGIVSAVFVIFLSVTGLFLNHTSELGLGARAVKSEWLLGAYGINLPTVHSAKLSVSGKAHWVSELDGQLFFNDQTLARCDGAMVAVVELEKSWALACEYQLFVFDHENQILDLIDANFGLPVPLTAAYLCDAQICLSTSTGHYRLDLDSLAFAKLDSGANSKQRPLLTQLRPLTQPPQALEQKLLNKYGAHSLTWERIMLDMHAGRFMGPLGPWIMDVVALVFLFLAFSGIVIWLRSGQSKRPHTKKYRSKRLSSRE